MDSAGATHISFNAITKLNLEKALKNIAAEVGLQLSAELLTSIADGANGDLRNAVETLQLAAAGMPLNKAARNHKGKVRTLLHGFVFTTLVASACLCKAVSIALLGP